MPKEKFDDSSVPKEEKKLIKGIAEAADNFMNEDEYDQIKMNYDYFGGGDDIEKSLRGGYKRFELGGLSSEKDADRSPKTGEPLWRAPAQKDDECWTDFTRRRLVYVNYTRLIVQERGSILYKTPPVREVEGSLKDQIEGVYSDPINSSKGKFVAFHRNAILGGTVAVVPYPDKDQKKIILRGYPRKNFHCVFDPYSGEMLGFCIFGSRYNWANKQTEEFYQVWTKEGVYNLNASKRIESVEFHYCGEIPVCLFRENNDDLSELNYGTVAASDLVNNNEDINIKISDLAFGSESQAFSLLFTVNVGQHVRAGARGRIDAKDVTEEQPVSAEYLNPGAQLAELQTILTSSIETLFMTGRIPKGIIMPDDTATSGVHLKIQWFPVQKLFDEAKVVYGDNERRLAKIIALSLSRWLPEKENAKVPDIEMTVDFNEKNVMPQDDETRMKQEEWDLSHGLLSPVQILMKRNPDLDEEEAIEEYQHIQELNKKIGFTPGGGGQGEFKKKRPTSALVEEIEAEETEEAEAA